MRAILCGVGLGLVLTFVPAALAQNKKADPDKAMPADKNAPKTQKEALDKMHVGGAITGKLTQWGASDKSFTVHVTLSHSEINPSEYKAMLDEQAYASDPRRSAQDRLQHLRNAADHQTKLYSAKKTEVDLHFMPAADMKVRTATPLVFDDKGKPKKLTAKEKAELKGPDKTLPGYTADMTDIHQDSYVTVYIPKKKPSKTPAPKDDNSLADTTPEAIMILIVGEMPAK